MDQDREAVNSWVKLGLRIGVSSAVHPFEYAKVLMQIGFEPIAPKPGRSLLGSQVMVLPNIFTYTGYLKRVDGVAGLFRGLSPKLVGMVLGAVVSEKAANELGLVEPEKAKDDEYADELLKENFQRSLRRELFLHATGIVVSHPFHVVSVRMMAQFVGKETKYTSIFGSLATIVREEGVLGLFSGVIPRLLADILCLVLASTTTYLVHKNIIHDMEQRQYFGSFNNFIWAGILYPFHLVSTCVIVSGSGLSAGRPPNMPLYSNWSDCFRMLKVDGELKRGSSVFFRHVRFRKATYGTAPYPTIQRFN